MKIIKIMNYNSNKVPVKIKKFENVSGANITGRKEGSAGLVMEGGKQNPFAGKASPNNKNTHPTVKPTDLMQYLVRLVTPNNGIILDPFNGSGSTGKAVMYETLIGGDELVDDSYSIKDELVGWLYDYENTIVCSDRYGKYIYVEDLVDRIKELTGGDE